MPSPMMILVPRYDAEHDIHTWLEILTGDNAPTEDSPVVFEYGGPHEEGYSWTREEYWVDFAPGDSSAPPKVFHRELCDSRDCDGQYSSEALYYWDGELWQTIDSSQRDHTAEKAGY